MTSRSTTKDEKFVLCLYDSACKAGDPYAAFDRYEIGKLCGLAAKAVDTICVLLGQANFIKKVGDVNVRLTPNGEALAKSLHF